MSVLVDIKYTSCKKVRDMDKMRTVQIMLCFVIEVLGLMSGTYVAKECLTSWKR